MENSTGSEDNNFEKKIISIRVDTWYIRLKNKQSIDLLTANIIPATKYFKSKFDHMRFKIDYINQDINVFKLRF